MDPSWNPFRCAVCGSTDVESVRARWEAGTWTTRTTGYVAGGVYTPGYSDCQGHWHSGHYAPMGGWGVQSSVHRTGLATVLAPPERPARESTWQWWLLPALGILAWMVGAVDWLSMYSEGEFTSLPYVVLTVALLVSVPALVALALWVRRIEEEADRRNGFAVLRHRAEMETWMRLVHCTRCNSVTDPATGRHAPAELVREIL